MSALVTLPHLASHVPRAIQAGSFWMRPHRRRHPQATLPRVRATHFEGASPKEDAPIRTTRSLLPLRLGRGPPGSPVCCDSHDA